MTAYERDTKLDAPDATVRAILLKPPGSWNDHERRIMSNRMLAEESVGMGADNPNSVRYGLPTQTGTTTTPATPTQPSAPAATEPKPPRGGNPAFESTMNDFGAYMRGINDGSVKPTLPGPTKPTPRVEQNPGSNYVPNNPAIALAPHEAAGGASATVPKQGTPGQFSVNSLPQGFTSYQNRDGGWTIIGTDGKPQQFASEADAAMWLNGGVAAPAAPAPGTAPFTPPAGYAEASPAGQARMRDEARNAADLAKYGQPQAPTPGKTSARPDPRGANLEPTLASAPSTYGGPYGLSPVATRPAAPPAAPVPAASPAAAPAVASAPTPFGAAMFSPFRGMGMNPGMAPQPAAPVLPPAAPVQAPNLRPPVTTPELRQASDVARRFNPLDPGSSRTMVMSY
jgi:hypothetical protein